MEVVLGILVVIGAVAFGWGMVSYVRKSNRRNDDYVYYSRKARSISWFATLGMIILFFYLLEFMNIDMDMIPVLGILWFVHVASWGISLLLFVLHGLGEQGD